MGVSSYKKNRLFNCCSMKSNDAVILKVMKQNAKENVFLVLKISTKIDRDIQNL